MTEEEREENVRLLEEVVEAEFPPDEMADATFRDKVCLGLEEIVATQQMSINSLKCHFLIGGTWFSSLIFDPNYEKQKL